jgi:hypothetical protein
MLQTVTLKEMMLDLYVVIIDNNGDGVSIEDAKRFVNFRTGQVIYDDLTDGVTYQPLVDCDK